MRLVGAGGPGARIMAATGEVRDNIIRGHGGGLRPDGVGSDPNNVSGGIQMYQTQGVQLEGNRIEEPSPFGISLWYDNANVSVGNTMVVDPWSDQFATPSAVGLCSTGNSVRLGAVQLRTGERSAGYRDVGGVYARTAKGNSMKLTGGHGFTAAATPFAGARLAAPHI
ncbi:hypothetical protein VV02_09845 [Luteipulveratus mongoliensis]|uniref:Right handed beta helix domain-containing protein n=1 Tax=Luteipulveratus mongoliensis TaxID=571913 RepID=A0A0K1JHL8_9MICO|nr:hypothetical protein VV02_09845 [Luteipulveratus mongoliensis]